MPELTRICSTIDAAKDRRGAACVNSPSKLGVDLTQQSPPPPISAGPKPGFEAGFDAGFDAADDGEQGPDTDGLAAAHTGMPGSIAAAMLEAANEALVAKLGATLADMRSLQRQNENWRTECQRLSALLVETQQELARRTAMPARALRR